MNQKKKNHLLVQAPMSLWASILFISGCGPTMQVQSDTPTVSAFSNIKTYYWMAKPHTGEIRIDNDQNFHALLQSAVNRELGNKGYIRSSTAPADFAITYSGKLDRTATTKAWRTQYRPGLTLGNPGTVNYVEDKGQLTLKFVNPDSKQVFWQGSASDKLDPSVKQTDKTRKQLNEAINKILSNIPDAQR